MAEISTWNVVKIVEGLSYMQRECGARGLNRSKSWATELCDSLNLSEEKSVLSYFSLSQHHDITNIKDLQLYLRAKSYYDLQEYDRAAHFLSELNHPKLYFLYMYCRYLSDEKKKIDNSSDALTTSVMYRQDNKELKVIMNELSERYPKQLDGFSLYLYGVVLRKLGLQERARNILEESIASEPLNWSAWCELALLITDREMLSTLTLPDHWIKQFFLASIYLSLQMNEEGVKLYQAIQDWGFTDCPYIKMQIAIAYHNVRDTEVALKTFEDLEQLDPYRLQNMDTYSNLLYVKEMRAELAHLAHRCCDINKYCPETCCVIGNYYSLRGEHEKAIMYFQRVLKLNPHYLSAWTLMGHEYMEIKNTSAAVHAYRQALEVNKRDYRAWYGLGQTYEILKMPFYCLYYYQQAQMLRPNDSRMIVALGDCYEKLDRLQEAKKCFWKAHNVGDIEGMALIKLAKLYERLSESDQAAAAYADYITEADAKRHFYPEHQSHAYKYLANYHLTKGNLDDAEAAAQKCSNFPETREEAKVILKQVARLRALQSGPIGDMFLSPVQSLERTPFSRLTPMNLRFTPS